MPELLLEVGCEELPASFVIPASADLARAISVALQEARLVEGVAVPRTWSTPRRLIVSVDGLAIRQPDEEKEVRGPALKSAYLPDGSPTPALAGFLRGQGAEPAALYDDGQYVWVRRHFAGRPTPEILAELLPAAIRGLSFEKSMRWGASRLRFARPIRWILALFDGQTVEFAIEDVASGHLSRGHRFYAPETFAVRNTTELLAGLRSRFVEPDPEKRRLDVIVGAQAAAAANAGSPDLPDALVDENVNLCEWPTVIRGEFAPGFLALPEPVLVTAMAKHERMFPLRGPDGRLQNAFLFVRNGGKDDTVRRGCEWVLNARFNDAKFFYEADHGVPLSTFLERTQGILFQEKLGTVRARADRLGALAADLARASGADAQEITWAETAGMLAKADLSSGLVSELASLQGVIGAEYAHAEGYPPAVIAALARQYRFDVQAPENAEDRTALRVMMADNLDKLAGYLGLGMEPTGSSDPYGLRRAATVLIECAAAWPSARFDFGEALNRALDLYVAQGVALDSDAAQTALRDLFASRYDALYAELPHDVRAAAISGANVTTPAEVRFRIECLLQARADLVLVQTATRPMNLVAAAKRKGVDFAWEGPPGEDPLESAAGDVLRELLRDLQPTLSRAVAEQDCATLLAALTRLNGPVNAFFDETMIMADDETLRFRRLSLAYAAAQAYARAGDFTLLNPA